MDISFMDINIHNMYISIYIYIIYIIYMISIYIYCICTCKPTPNNTTVEIPTGQRRTGHAGALRSFAEEAREASGANGSLVGGFNG